MLTPEQSQRITDLRQRMYQNIGRGLPAHEGITKEELREALAFVRGSRSQAAAKATKAKAAKPGKPAAGSVNLDVFGDLD